MLQIRQSHILFSGKIIVFFLISSQNLNSWFSLELPHKWSFCNIMFGGEIRKQIIYVLSRCMATFDVHIYVTYLICIICSVKFIVILLFIRNFCYKNVYILLNIIMHFDCRSHEFCAISTRFHIKVGFRRHSKLYKILNILFFTFCLNFVFIAFVLQNAWLTNSVDLYEHSAVGLVCLHMPFCQKN